MGYQGSRSRKLARTIDLNRVIPGDTFDLCSDGVNRCGSKDGMQTATLNSSGTLVPLATPIPTGNNRFNRIFFPWPDVNASFDAGVFHVSRRFNRGFQVDGTYTWSHA